MNKIDQERLKWLMEHYRRAYTRSIADLRAYRSKFANGKLPDNSARPDMEEWEGPFFCRIIDGLLTGQERESVASVVFKRFKKQDRLREERR
jgi:hypothetical protein